MSEETKLPDYNKNPSEWFTQIIKQAELADNRYGVKGCLVFQPWSVESMELMYDYFETELKNRGHKNYWFPTLIPENYFYKEAEHIEGFSPEVFWVEKGGTSMLEEKLALRPTSETAFYTMFAFWIRSHKDLPFKTYQRANVFRFESKATRPFLRSREFYWLEAHCAFATEEEATQNVLDDINSTKKIVFEVFGVPTMVFERPSWDKFAGAHKTFGADAFTPSGRVVQQPSTHIINQHFTKSFGVKFVDKDEQEKTPWTTCYGPAISRLFASVILTHGDNKGLKFPFEIAPKQIVITPILFEKNKGVLEKAIELTNLLKEAGYRVELDDDPTKRIGEKFFYWEMKGVPLRIEIGPNEIKSNQVQLYRRDTNQKIVVSEKELLSVIKQEGVSLSENLKEKASNLFKGIIRDVSTISEVSEVVGKGIARTNFCSIGAGGEECAKVIDKETSGKVRGSRIDVVDELIGEKKCVVCGKPATKIVYIAKDY